MNLCALAVPTGPRADARPGSVTFIAAAGRDASIAAEAQRLMRQRDPVLGATGRLEAEVPETPVEKGAAGDEIVLAVCGAHMSGLPLNPELTRRGARLIGPAQTAPAYALYALPGGPPQRPGLIRKSGPGGASIAVELWAMPKAEFGGFVEGIPAPLAIGTIALQDGAMVKGFVCEGFGVEGATDISALGGWRNFIAPDVSVAEAG